MCIAALYEEVDPSPANNKWHAQFVADFEMLEQHDDVGWVASRIKDENSFVLGPQ